MLPARIRERILVMFPTSQGTKQVTCDFLPLPAHMNLVHSVNVYTSTPKATSCLTGQIGDSYQNIDTGPTRHIPSSLSLDAK
jgi:hypothetical protein